MRSKEFVVLSLLLFLSRASVVFAGNGYFLHGIGAVNESLGGAAVAGNDQDLLGSLYKNPANAALFDGRVASISLGAIMPHVTFNSSVDALGLAGSSESDVDAIPTADLGMVFNNKSTAMAFYVAIVSEAGLHLDMPASSTNPIFFPQAGSPANPFGGRFGGFGAVESQLEIVRIPLGISYQLNSKWSAGASVAPSIARLKFTPAAFTAPNDANGDGIPTYPTNIDHDYTAGIGFQGGVRYQATDNVAVALSVVSPTWFQDFEWDVADEIGNNRKISFGLDRPLTLHFGGTWQLTDSTLLLTEAAWINYADTEGFESTGFSADGSLVGLGYDNTWVLVLGVQHRINDYLTLRAGYNYNKNPIDKEKTFFNVGSPLISEHHLSLGGSWRVSAQVTFDIGYTHAFSNSISGPWYGAAGTVPGTKIEAEMGYDQVSMGVTFSF